MYAKSFADFEVLVLWLLMLKWLKCPQFLFIYLFIHMESLFEAFLTLCQLRIRNCPLSAVKSPVGAVIVPLFSLYEAAPGFASRWHRLRSVWVSFTFQILISGGGKLHKISPGISPVCEKCSHSEFALWAQDRKLENDWCEIWEILWMTLIFNSALIILAISEVTFRRRNTQLQCCHS